MTNSRSFLIGPSNELSFVSGFPLKDDQKAKKFYPKPSLYGTTLLPVYLGVIFDNKMSFKQHFDKTYEKIKKGLNGLIMTKNLINY